MKFREVAGRIASHGYSGYSREELIEMAKPLFANVRRKINDLQKAGMTYSPALQGFLATGVSPYMKDYKDATVNELRHALKEAYTFVNAKTSTVAKTKAYWDWLESLVGTKVDTEMRETMGKLIGYMREYAPSMFQRYESDEAIENFFKGNSNVDELLKRFAPPDKYEEYLNEKSELMEQIFAGITGVNRDEIERIDIDIDLPYLDGGIDI